MAISKVSLLTSRIVRSLWFTPALYAAFAIAALAIAPILSPFMPDGMNDFIGLDGVYDLLNVLANTLLAVAIFSLGILAAAMEASAGTASPRAPR